MASSVSPFYSGPRVERFCSTKPSHHSELSCYRPKAIGQIDHRLELPKLNQNKSFQVLFYYKSLTNTGAFQIMEAKNNIYLWKEENDTVKRKGKQPLKHLSDFTVLSKATLCPISSSIILVYFFQQPLPLDFHS